MAAHKSRSARYRRKTLESLRSDKYVGPHIAGLHEAEPILIAEFYSRRICRRFQNTLSAHGIWSSTKSNRIKVLVYVRNADRRQAFELLDEHNNAHPDIRPVGIRRDLDATFLCALASILAGISVLGVWQNNTIRVVAWIGCAVSGLCVGYVIDRSRRNYVFYGQLQFSVTEILALTAVIAVLIAYWSFVFRM